MTLAILYDVHGNLPALEAVLADCGTERFLLGGDYALFGPFPAETVYRLRGLSDARWIRGNVDRWSAHPSQAPDDRLVQGAIAACREAIGESLASELGSLEQQIVLDGVRYCHASPKSDLESFMPSPGSEDDDLLAGAAERRIVFGHTHLAFRRVREDGVELFNPGSVGLPFDADQRAAYALVHDDGSIEHRRVAYDVQDSIGELSRRFGDAPWALRSMDRLRRARI